MSNETYDENDNLELEFDSSHVPLEDLIYVDPTVDYCHECGSWPSADEYDDSGEDSEYATSMADVGALEDHWTGRDLAVGGILLVGVAALAYGASKCYKEFFYKKVQRYFHNRTQRQIEKTVQDINSRTPNKL